MFTNEYPVSGRPRGAGGLRLARAAARRRFQGLSVGWGCVHTPLPARGVYVWIDHNGGVNRLYFEKIAKLIADQFDVDVESITPETSFADDLNADSLDLVELMMSLEEEFDLGEVEDDNLDSIKTVGDAVESIKERG